MIVQGKVNPEAKPVSSWLFGLVRVFRSEQDAADWSATTGKACVYVVR